MQISADVFDAATMLERVRSRTHYYWRGDAATAFAAHLGRGSREADQLSEEIERAGFALLAFSTELEAVAARLQQARAVAAEAGLKLTTQGIDPPPTVVLPAEPTTRHPAAASVDAHQAQVQAWHEAKRAVSNARDLELAAHERLAAATSTPQGTVENLRTGTGFIAMGVTRGVGASGVGASGVVAR